MQAWIFRAATVFGLCLLVYFFPLFHVVRLSQHGEATRAEEFDPAAFARDLWDNKLPDAIQYAAPASEVVAALAGDAQAAKGRFGRSIGLSKSFFVFIQGEGEVSKVAPAAVTVSLDGDPSSSVVVLSRGPLLDTALRDATGLLRIDDFPDMSHFNTLSAELNRLAEQEATPRLARLRPGDRVRFVGCGRIANAARYEPPLEISPVLIEAP